MTTKVYLPLKSNIGWFSEREAAQRFERLLKMHIALFDKLILEDGTYFFMSGGDGQGFEWKVGPDAIQGFDRTSLSFHSPGGEFGVAVGDQPLMQASLAFGCNADFLPIIHRAGLKEATYFEWVRRELKSEWKKQTDVLGESDLRDQELIASLPDDSFLKKELLKGFYRDALVAQTFKAPLAVDHHLAAFLAKKRERHQTEISESVPLVFYDRWLDLDLPNFADYSWERIHELHESPVGEDFRRMAERLSKNVTDALSSSPSPEDLRELVANAFDQEILTELRSRRAKASSTLVDVTLNLVPYGSLLSVVKDVGAFGRDKTSWVSLL